MSEAERKYFDFGDAIRALKDGKKVARAGWNGKGMWIAIVFDVEPTSIGCHNYRHNNYIVIRTPDNALTPWNASQQDALAEDWEVVE